MGYSRLERRCTTRDVHKTVYLTLFIAVIKETPGFYCPDLLIGPGLQWVGPAPGWVGGVATALEDDNVPFVTSQRATFPELYVLAHFC